MEVVTFVSELLNGLASLETVQDVTSQAEGPTVRGRAYFAGGLFLAFYYNRITGTRAFALVRDEQRIWGIDYDNLRGWHEHPLEQPESHILLQAQTIPSSLSAYRVPSLARHQQADKRVPELSSRGVSGWW